VRGRPGSPPAGGGGRPLRGLTPPAPVMGSDPEIAGTGDRPQNGTVTFVARDARPTPDDARTVTEGARTATDSPGRSCGYPHQRAATGPVPSPHATGPPPQLRVLRSRPAERRSGRPHLHLRVHVLRHVRDNVLENVCPNCGGGFVPRPIRPSNNWKGDTYLGKDPASTKVRHRPIDLAEHARFSAAIKTIPPHKR
jgi:hypothetical protein